MTTQPAMTGEEVLAVIDKAIAHAEWNCPDEFSDLNYARTAVAALLAERDGWVRGEVLLVVHGGESLCMALVCKQSDMDDAVKTLKANRLSHDGITAYLLAAPPLPPPPKAGE